MTKEEIINEIDLVVCPWVVLNFKEIPNQFNCTRCGAVEDAPMGRSLDWWLNFSRAFKMTHWDCEEMHGEFLSDDTVMS